VAEEGKTSGKLDELSKKVDEVVDEVGRRVDEAIGKVDEKVEEVAGRVRRKSRRKWDNTFWGIVLIVVGFLWLGSNLDWFDIHIPFWPAVLIVIGVYLLLEHRRD
jgi:fatty acid desaturase